jgi:hypothetical protein
MGRRRVLKSCNTDIALLPACCGGGGYLDRRLLPVRFINHIGVECALRLPESQRAGFSAKEIQVAAAATIMVTADRVGDPQAHPFSSRSRGMDDIEPRIVGRTGVRVPILVRATSSRCGRPLAHRRPKPVATRPARPSRQPGVRSRCLLWGLEPARSERAEDRPTACRP